MKFVYEIFSQMCVTFRDESNEPSSTMIGYSDATVTAPDHSLIAFRGIISYSAATVP